MILSIKDILNYSPYDKKFDNRHADFTEKTFIENFRYTKGRFETEFDAFSNIIKRDTFNHCEFAMLSGYSGCGKTTLLHYLAEKLTEKCGHTVDIISLTKISAHARSGIEILRMALEEQVMDLLKRSIACLQIIHDNYSDIRYYRTSEGPHNNLLEELYRIRNAHAAAKQNNNDTDFKNILRDFVSSINITELLVYYLFAKVLEFQTHLGKLEKYQGKNIEHDATEALVICFDNLDQLSLNELTVDFWDALFYAKTTVENIMDKLGLFMKGMLGRFMTIILTVREANISLCNSQWRDRFTLDTNNRRLILDGDVAEILKLRSDYIRKNKSLFNYETESKIVALMDIFNLEEDWVREQMLPLFNFDYRKFFQFLSSLLRYESAADHKIRYTLSFTDYVSYNTTNRTVSRGIMYSHLIDFALKTYFRRFICSPEESCNKYRLLLTIMYNLAYPSGVNEDAKERNKMKPGKFTLEDLLNEAKILPEEEIIKLVIEFFPEDQASFAQWIMLYNAKTNVLSNQPTKYATLKRKRPQDLTDKEKEFEKMVEDSTIYFNASAYAYLRYVITHYEYFMYLVRQDNSSLTNAPLALLTKVSYPDKKHHAGPTKDNITCFEFEKHICLVLDYVEQKKKGIEKYYEEFLEDKYPNEKEYSNSQHAFGETLDKKSFYISKVIFTHINYLDNFRYLSWYNSVFNATLNKERKVPIINTTKMQDIPVKSNDEIQDFLLDIITKYVELAKNIKFRDNRTDQLIKYMTKNISDIRKLKDASGKYRYPPDTGTHINKDWIWIRGDRSIND